MDTKKDENDIEAWSWWEGVYWKYEEDDEDTASNDNDNSISFSSHLFSPQHPSANSRDSHSDFLSHTYLPTTFVCIAPSAYIAFLSYLLKISTVRHFFKRLSSFFSLSLLNLNHPILHIHNAFLPSPNIIYAIISSPYHTTTHTPSGTVLIIYLFFRGWNKRKSNFLSSFFSPQQEGHDDIHQDRHGMDVFILRNFFPLVSHLKTPNPIQFNMRKERKDERKLNWVGKRTRTRERLEEMHVWKNKQEATQ